MRKFIVVIIATLFFAACSQSVDSPANSEDGIITFDANGQYIKYSGTYESLATTAYGVAGDKIILLGDTLYNLNGQSGANNLCIFQIKTDSLKKQTYSYLQFGIIAFDMDGKQYGIFPANPKNFTLAVTHHSGGRLDATFSGSLYSPIDLTDPTKGYDSIIVTNGEIKNMEMIY